MTKLKKFMFGIVSIVTAFSMLAFTACSDSDVDDNTSDQTPTENTGETNSENEGEDVQEEEEDYIISKAIAATGEVTYKSAELNMDGKYEYTDSSFDSQGDSYDSVISANVLFDFDSLNYDLYTTEADDDGSYLYYSFVRDGYEFYYSDSTDDSQETASAGDITSNTALKTYYGDTVELDDIFGIILNEDYMQTLQTMPFAVASLAERYDAVTVDDSSITVNIGLLVSSLYNEVSAIINSVTETTTVAALLENDLVEDLLDAVSVGMDASTIYEFVLGIFEFEGIDTEDITEIIPAPSEGDSLYEYICSLADDEEFFKTVTGVNMSGATLGKLSVEYVFESLFGVSLEALQTYFDVYDVSYSDGVVNVEISYEEYEEDEYQYSYTESVSIGGNLIYNLNSDYTLKSVTVDCEFSTNTDISWAYSESDKYSYCAYEAYDIEASIELSTSEATLEDISSNPVTVRNSSATYDTVDKYIEAVEAIEEDDIFESNYYYSEYAYDEEAYSKNYANDEIYYVYAYISIDKLAQSGELIFDFYCFTNENKEIDNSGVQELEYNIQTYCWLHFTYKVSEDGTVTFDNWELYDNEDDNYTVKSATLNENGEIEVTIEFTTRAYHIYYDSTYNVTREITLYFYAW